MSGLVTLFRYFFFFFTIKCERKKVRILGYWTLIAFVLLDFQVIFKQQDKSGLFL